MGPKKNTTAEEVEEIKKALDVISEEVKAIRTQQSSIIELVKEVKALRMMVNEKDKRIEHLENKVAELEQYTRQNDVVITGLRIKPRSYARAVSNESEREPSEPDGDSVEQQVVGFLQAKGIKVECKNIDACYSLPVRKSGGTPVVIMKLTSRKHKITLLKQGKQLKGTDVYMNEHLVKHTAEIARKARSLRKERKIQNTWTYNCKVYIKLNGTPEEAKVMCIKNITELDKL